ncbi:MAG: phytanoyl-CoA dioxygenase family protein [Planctomycetota bacterium]
MVSFELNHLFQADPAALYRCWTDPEVLARWLSPAEGFEVTRVQADVRPGGRLAVAVRTPAGAEGEIAGEYRDVRPDERLSFTWCVRGTGTPLDGAESIVTVTLSAAEGGTALRLLHEGLADAGEVEAYRHAWFGAVGRLPGELLDSHEVFFERVTSQPRPTSRFGGFWTDFENAEARIAGREELGWLAPDEAARFRHWCEKGYVVLEDAVPEDVVDRLAADVEQRWSTPQDELHIEHYDDELVHIVPMAPEHRGKPHKVLDLHGYSQAARDAVFAPAIKRFLGQLFERPPMAFQSLLFTYGTEQDMHQDTAYVLLRSPMEFVGCWIALEDVEPGSGELQYYEGSHRIPEYLWFERSRAKPYDVLDERDFRAWMNEGPRERGLPLVKFRPRKGDALLWHADLVHGGSKERNPALTRRSYVTHFTPVDVDPEWFGASRHSDKLRDASGGYYCYQVRGEGES